MVAGMRRRGTVRRFAIVLIFLLSACGGGDDRTEPTFSPLLTALNTALLTAANDYTDTLSGPCGSATRVRVSARQRGQSEDLESPPLRCSDGSWAFTFDGRAFQDGAIAITVQDAGARSSSTTQEFLKAATLVWPDDAPSAWLGDNGKANSSRWLIENFTRITEMRPRFIAINFANCRAEGGTASCFAPLSSARIKAYVLNFYAQLTRATVYREWDTHWTPHRPYINVMPDNARFVDLRDDSEGVNSALLPRGTDIITYYCDATDTYFDTPALTYAPLFGPEFAPYFDGKTLDQMFIDGEAHEVIVIANQVDANPCDLINHPVDQWTAGLAEVMQVQPAYSYDEESNAFTKTAHLVRNAIESNDLSYHGQSKRVHFMNSSHGEYGLHGFTHLMEVFYSRQEPDLMVANDCATPDQPCTRFARDADFANTRTRSIPYLGLYYSSLTDTDLTEQGSSETSFYAMDDACTYQVEASGDTRLSCDPPHGDPFVLEPFVTGCGNAHYPPGAVRGYDYDPPLAVSSYCTSFMRDALGHGRPTLTKMSLVTAYLTPSLGDRSEDKFFIWHYQNWPGYRNKSYDRMGRPMLNWWSFIYF